MLAVVDKPRAQEVCATIIQAQTETLMRSITALHIKTNTGNMSRATLFTVSLAVIWDKLCVVADFCKQLVTLRYILDVGNHDLSIGDVQDAFDYCGGLRKSSASNTDTSTDGLLLSVMQVKTWDLLFSAQKVKFDARGKEIRVTHTLGVLKGSFEGLNVKMMEHEADLITALASMGAKMKLSLVHMEALDRMSQTMTTAQANQYSDSLEIFDVTFNEVVIYWYGAWTSIMVDQIECEMECSEDEVPVTVQSALTMLPDFIETLGVTIPDLHLDRHTKVMETCTMFYKALVNLVTAMYTRKGLRGLGNIRNEFDDVGFTDNSLVLQTGYAQKILKLFNNVEEKGDVLLLDVFTRARAHLYKHLACSELKDQKGAEYESESIAALEEWGDVSIDLSGESIECLAKLKMVVRGNVLMQQHANRKLPKSNEKLPNIISQVIDFLRHFLMPLQRSQWIPAGLRPTSDAETEIASAALVKFESFLSTIKTITETTSTALVDRARRLLETATAELSMLSSAEDEADKFMEEMKKKNVQKKDAIPNGKRVLCLQRELECVQKDFEKVKGDEKDGLSASSQSAEDPLADQLEKLSKKCQAFTCTFAMMSLLKTPYIEASSDVGISFRNVREHSSAGFHFETGQKYYCGSGELPPLGRNCCFQFFRWAYSAV